MATHAVPMLFGDVEVLVEVVTLAGNEPTSAGEHATGQLVDVLGRTRDIVRAVSGSITNIHVV